MSDSNNFFKKFKQMPVDSITKTVIVATTLCFVCSMVVSFAAVNLKSIQEVNKAIDKQKNILQVAGVYYEGIDVQKTFSSFQPAVVDLNTGKFTDKFDPLSKETIWEKNVVMWPVDIGNVIEESFNKEAWQKADSEVRKRNGWEGLRRKNGLLIAATVEKLWNEGQKSEILEKLCQYILDFAKSSYSINR